MNHLSSPYARPKLSIGLFLESAPLTQVVLQHLAPDRHTTTVLQSSEEFCAFVEQEKQRLDCLILEANPTLPHLAKWMHGQATLLPAVIVASASLATGRDPEVHGSQPSDPGISASTAVNLARTDLTFTYHTAEIWITADQVDTIDTRVEQAIAQFLDLSPNCRLGSALSTIDLTLDLSAQNFLMLQQRRLSDKLKERLGYLGVYYKRNPRNFFRYLSPTQQQEMLEKLREDYREIVLHYFEADSTLNQRIDEFVNVAFFADIATSQIVEIHMDLMDEFAKQLKLEGRGDDILLDYRLTLIDTIAHLCEMYRRSVPKEA